MRVTAMVGVVLVLVGVLSGCGFGRKDPLEEVPPEVWGQRAVAAIERTPNVQNEDVEGFVQSSPVGESIVVIGVVTLTGSDPEADYLAMLRNVSEALGRDAPLSIDIRGRTPGGRTIRADDVGIYVRFADNVWDHFHGGGSSSTS